MGVDWVPQRGSSGPFCDLFVFDGVFAGVGFFAFVP